MREVMDLAFPARHGVHTVNASSFLSDPVLPDVLQSLVIILDILNAVSYLVSVVSLIRTQGRRL